MTLTLEGFKGQLHDSCQELVDSLPRPRPAFMPADLVRNDSTVLRARRVGAAARYRSFSYERYQ